MNVRWRRVLYGPFEWELIRIEKGSVLNSPVLLNEVRSLNAHLS